MKMSDLLELAMQVSICFHMKASEALIPAQTPLCIFSEVPEPQNQHATGSNHEKFSPHGTVSHVIYQEDW